MDRRKPITIRKERFYAHSPLDVWTAITDPRALAEWFEPNDHEPVAGHEFQFVCDPGICGDAVSKCRVVEADPPRKLVWSWVHAPRKDLKAPSDPMTITWTLSPEPGGTRLSLEHTNAENISWLQRNMMRVGWGYMMKTLIPKVLGNVLDGRFTPGAIPLEKRAYKCETVPERYVR